MKKTAVLALILIFLTALCMTAVKPAKAQLTTIIVPNDYPTISAAIGNATDGDTIIVENGTYTGQTLEINKSLTIISEYVNGAQISLHPPQIPENLFGETIMVYTNPIAIEANNVNLSGFTITSDGGDISANGNQIQLINNTIGTETTPIRLLLTGDGTQIISNTMATLSLTGSNQTVADNYLGSIAINGSFNFITRNNAGSIALTGSKNAVTGNFFNVNGFNEGAGIDLSGADYNIVSNNTETGNLVGIAVDDGGSYNIFAGNTVEKAGLWGILMANGSYNVFYGNLIANNGGLGHDGYGLALGGNHLEVENNLFFCNIFMNNSHNFGANWVIIGANSFDNGKEGNYWDDYLRWYPYAKELDHSGIGNTPYRVYANDMDNYPLMNKPDISDIVPALPSPWSSLLSIIPLTPSSPYVSSASPSASLQPTQSPEPTTPLTLSTVYITVTVVAAVIIVVIVTIAVMLKKRGNKD
jgi:parallel beta-helix repeat protein